MTNRRKEVAKFFSGAFVWHAMTHVGLAFSDALPHDNHTCEKYSRYDRMGDTRLVARVLRMERGEAHCMGEVSVLL